MPFRMSRSALIRMALAVGLDELEQRGSRAPDSGPKSKAPGKANVTFKVGQKGGVSVYGLGNKWPTTLYREQWEQLLEHSDELHAFLRQHRKELK